ncbi:unnamed protein product [Sympodiomycopsis kandeliae]
MSGNVKVVSRFRPPNALELREGGDIVVDFDDGDDTTVKLKGGPTSGPEAAGFTFDRCFPMNTRQQDVFEYGIKETVDDVINGYNGTIFAYGQTGSGKTFTMMGSDIDDPNLKGIIPRITEQIFDSIMSSPPNLEYLVKVSYMEIYMEKIRDLLAPQNDNLQIHEEKSRGVYVKGLSDYYVGGQEDVYEIMRQGGNARAVSSTNMNAESSRSHSIFVVAIQQKNTDTGSQKTGNLYLVDLAGSEKVGKTGASGQTLEEAKKINKSLSALGMVINALTDGKSSHIPYRDSKLTRILQESLGGNSRTTLIVNASPCAYNAEETISTLRFGVRAKSIKNKARVNAELSPAELKTLLKKAQSEAARYQQYIAALESELKIWRSGTPVPEADRVELGKAVPATSSVAGPAAAPAASVPSTPRPGSVAGIRPTTPATPAAVEGLREAGVSRPDTPTSVDKDEREEFLRRENELSDQIAERETALKAAEASLKELREELAFFKEQESTLSNDNKNMTAQLNEIKLQLERVTYEHKEAGITMDIIKEQNTDLSNELEELRKNFNDGSRNAGGLSATGGSRDPDAEEKDRRRKERVERMMKDLHTDGFNDKEAAIRDSLAKLDQTNMSSEDSAQVREQMLEIAERHREVSRLLEEVQIERDNASLDLQNAEVRMADMREAYDNLVKGEGGDGLRAGIEAQYSDQRKAQQSEIDALKRQVDQKARELSALHTENESMRAAHDELKRAFAVTTAGVEGGQNLLESAREMERVRKTMAQQLAEFDTMKKSLMRDLQNRCEKVVELEISLDESREQYNNVVRSSNTKAQQKKMAFLERNLEQLTNVQKQLVEQNQSLKKEVAIAERKLNARNERIQNLESLLAESQERINQQNAKYEAQMALVRERFESAKNLSRSIGGGGAGGPGLNFGRIAKPLRGGGNTTTGPQPGPTAVSAAGAGAPPRHAGLSNVQQQAAGFDSKSPKARSSWFFSSS